MLTPRMQAPRIPCPNCGARIDAEFCAKCGERRPHPDELTLRKLGSQTLDGLTHLDGKTPRSAWLLLAKPGFLTAEYVRGAHKRFVKPTTLFLIANTAYYLLQPLTGLNTFRTTLTLQGQQPYSRLTRPLVEAKLAQPGIDREVYAAAFDARSESLSKLLLIVFVPLLATVIAAIYRPRRRPFGEHLVLALHFKAFVLSYVCLLVMPFAQLLSRLVGNRSQGDDLATAMTFVLIAVYLAMAFRRLFADTWPRAALRAFLAALGYTTLVYAYRAALFLITFWLT